MNTQTVKPELKNPEMKECQNCNGTGIYIDVEQECCGNYDMSIWCCGHFTQKQVQTQCVECEATGYCQLREGGGGNG